MTKKKFLSPGIAVAIFMMLLASCSKPEPVSFAGYRNVRFSNHGFSTGIIQMDVAFFNPNPFPMKIKETALQVLINQKPFGQTPRTPPASCRLRTPFSCRSVSGLTW